MAAMTLSPVCRITIRRGSKKWCGRSWLSKPIAIADPAFFDWINDIASEVSTHQILVICFILAMVCIKDPLRDDFFRLLRFPLASLIRLDTDRHFADRAQAQVVTPHF